ncbi:MAG: S41 family peptidase [Bacteroidota bacterium]
MKKSLILLSLFIAFTSSLTAQNITVLKTEDLDKYLGTYSSTQLELKITISKNNTTLMGQGTGQSAFALDVSAKDRFVYHQTGIELVFDTSRNKMTLNQGGETYWFTNEDATKKTLKQPIIYQPEAMQADLSKFKNALIKTFPGLYTNQSPEEFESLTNNLMSEISQPMEATSFYKVLRKIRIYDDHTGFFPVNELASILSNQKTLPFDVYVKDERIFIVKNMSSLPIPDGSELLAIDGRLSNDIIQEFFKYYSTDGKSHAGLQYLFGLPGRFSYFYAQTFGEKPLHAVSYRDYKSKQILTVQVEPVSNELFSTNRAKKYPSKKRPSEDAFNFELNKPENYAILKINRFFKDSFQDPENTYPDFYKKCFQEISANTIKSLIIDLRDNGGGDAKNTGYLLQYFIDKPVTLAKETTTLGDNEYFLKTTGDRLELDEKYGMVKQDDRTFKVTKFDILRELAPFNPVKEYQFKGKLVVLINGNMFSAAGTAAGLIKEYTNAVLVGSETAGYAGISNGVQKITVRGDFTETAITIPLLHTVYTINPVIQKRGAIPDYDVSNSLQDMLENRDSVLEFVFKRLLNKKNK